MVEQLSLGGFESAAVPTDRLFFAIRPDADAAARIAELGHALRDSHGLKGAPLELERLHITLYFLGDFAGLPAGVVAEAEKAAASLKRAPLELVFDRVVSFTGRERRPLVLVGGEGLHELRAFRASLASAMLRVGLKDPSSQKFEPHVTLLYDQRAVPIQPIESLRWRAHEFVLVRSLLGQSRHEVLARWPLNAQGGV